MLLDFCEVGGHRAKYSVLSNAVEPAILLDSKELGHSGQGHLRNLVKVQVEGPDGRLATVWVAARLNARGQVQFELASNKRDRTQRVNLTANWRL